MGAVTREQALRRQQPTLTIEEASAAEPDGTRTAGMAELDAAPVVQVIKYDADEQKVNKLWAICSLTYRAGGSRLGRCSTDFREAYEIPDETSPIPAFWPMDELVVRELLVNALVHRPYTQRGDFFRIVSADPVHDPGGVSPQNILHFARQPVHEPTTHGLVFEDSNVSSGRLFASSRTKLSPCSTMRHDAGSRRGSIGCSSENLAMRASRTPKLSGCIFAFARSGFAAG